MSANARFDLLQSSVDVIRLTHAVTAHKQVEDWKWYFRGWVQWHSIAIVIAELGGNQNRQFVNTAWAVLDPILDGWDKVYRIKKDEPAWEHVNMLIERARQMRRQVPAAKQSLQHAPNPSQALISNMIPMAQTIPQDSLSTLQTPGVWQAKSWSSFDMLDTVNPQFEQPYNPQQLSAPPTGAMGVLPPLETGCTPEVHGLDNTDFGYIEGLDSIDFSAFDAVFGDTAWEYSSPSTDLNMESMNS